MAKSKGVQKKRSPTFRPLLTQAELAKLGTGKVVYIRKMDHEEAGELYPNATLPRTAHVFAVHDAQGSTIALTDSRQAAIGYAREDELEVAQLH